MRFFIIASFFLTSQILFRCTSSKNDRKVKLYNKEKTNKPEPLISNKKKGHSPYFI